MEFGNLESDSLYHKVIRSKFGLHSSGWDALAGPPSVSYLSPWKFI